MGDGMDPKDKDTDQRATLVKLGLLPDPQGVNLMAAWGGVVHDLHRHQMKVDEARRHAHAYQEELAQVRAAAIRLRDGLLWLSTQYELTLAENDLVQWLCWDRAPGQEVAP